MAELPLYAHWVDVLRKYDPTLTESDLDNNNYIGVNDRSTVRARIDAVCNEFEEKTGQAFRRLRIGAKDEPTTLEYQEVEGKRLAPPLRLDLDFRQVHPFDSSEDDLLEIREGRDSWSDVTDEAGNEFTLDYREGSIKLYRWLIEQIWWDAPDDRYVRASYRCGALGGDRRLGGQTTLSSDLASDTSTTAVDVADANRLPEAGPLLIGNDEYVRLTSTDRSTDTLTVDRAVRATSTSSHSSGDPIHYCPEYLRDAVAAKTARELLRYEDWVDNLTGTPETAQGASDKMDDWQAQWEELLGRESEVRRL